ncbi:MAG: hypothetical protein GEV07_26460 [Streptosporangiales bacterium]|nr:hypothetical protein [Streptosporangiales bacterium]
MAPDAGTVAVGHAAVELGVPAGTPLGGYADRTLGATGSSDPLELRVVTMTDGRRRFVWAIADLVCVNTDLAAAVRTTVPDTTSWLSATHTHAGPETGCRPGGAATPAPWRDRLTDAVAAAAAAAVRAETPAALVLRHGELTDVAGQRSGPQPRQSVPFDVLEFRAGSTTHGVLVVLPVHPTVLGADNTCTSADLPGAVRRALGERLPGTWCVVATGAAGDVSTRPHRRAQDPRELARLGDLVAGQVASLLQTPGRDVTGDGAVAAVAAEGGVPLPPRTDPPADKALLADLDRQVDQLPAGSAARRTAYTRLQGARLAHQAVAVRGPTCAVGVLTVGELRLAAVGAEPYLELADRWRALAGPDALLVGYTGGYLGYLPTRAAYETNEYEAAVSPCGPGAGERVIDECDRLLSKSTAQRK